MSTFTFFLYFSKQTKFSYLTCKLQHNYLGIVTPDFVFYVYSTNEIRIMGRGKYYNLRQIRLPERIGWTLLRRTVKAKRRERWLTASRTGLLEVKIRAISLWNSNISSQKTRPITTDSHTDTIVANLAPFPFPAPSSFATLTLHHTHFINIQSPRSRWVDLFITFKWTTYYQ